MAKQETGNRPGIGSPSLILIFIVMCLVTFGMLSLSTAKSELDLAERNAASVTEYYRADREGEEFCRLVSEAAKEARQEGADIDDVRRLLGQKLGEYYIPERDAAMTQIAMDRSQALLIEVFPSLEEGQASVISQWKVIQTEDFEIYDSMPVWTGGEGEE